MIDPVGSKEYTVSINRDIKSAVEWLKEQLIEDELFVDLAHIIRIVDKAFEDVIKKSGTTKCKICGNPMEDTPNMKYGRFSDNEQPSSPKLWFCNCGKITEV